MLFPRHRGTRLPQDVVREHCAVERKLPRRWKPRARWLGPPDAAVSSEDLARKEALGEKMWAVRTVGKSSSGSKRLSLMARRAWARDSVTPLDGASPRPACCRSGDGGGCSGRAANVFRVREAIATPPGKRMRSCLARSLSPVALVPRGYEVLERLAVVCPVPSRRRRDMLLPLLLRECDASSRVSPERPRMRHTFGGNAASRPWTEACTL